MKKLHHKLKYCTNCGCDYPPDADNFCPRCGQENHNRVIPLSHLFAEFFESVLHFDSKVYKTLRSLLFHPGELTAAFVQGKRVAFVAPIRLYVFVSFVFFLVLSAVTSRSREPDTAVGEPAGNHLNISFYNISADTLRGLTDRACDSLMVAYAIEPTAFNAYALKQWIHVANEGTHTFFHTVIKNVSYAMFFLMPLFALLLFLIERKARPYYVSCLVGSIHFHCFLFTLLLVVVLAMRLLETRFLILLGLLIPAIYLYAMMKRLYWQSFFTTLGKTLVVGLLYIVVILAGTILTIFTSILLF
jgi:hypothetical protein